MTPDDLKKLREKAEAATPGQWGTSLDGVHVDHMVYSDTDADNTPIVTSWGTCHGGGDFGEANRNAAFIAAANPATVIALLDDLDRLRAKVSDMRSERVRAEEQLSVAAAEVERLRTEAALVGPAMQELRTQHAQQLAAMTAARDEACDIAECLAADMDYDTVRDERAQLAALRLIGQTRGDK